MIKYALDLPERHRTVRRIPAASRQKRTWHPWLSIQTSCPPHIMIAHSLCSVVISAIHKYSWRTTPSHETTLQPPLSAIDLGDTALRLGGSPAHGRGIRGAAESEGTQ